MACQGTTERPTADRYTRTEKQRDPFEGPLYPTVFLREDYKMFGGQLLIPSWLEEEATSPWPASAPPLNERAARGRTRPRPAGTAARASPTDNPAALQ